MNEELRDLEMEYQEERAGIERKYEEMIESLKESLSFMVDVPTDPAELAEYSAEKARLEGELSIYEEQLQADIDAIDAVYDAKREDVYEKYGR